MRVAYVISQYPMRSLTFIRREMATLSARGVDIRTYSLRKCPQNELLDEDDAREFRDTWSVFPLRLPHLLATHLRALLSRPGDYLRTLMLALRCRPAGGGGALFALFYFAESILLARQLRADGIDRIHVHFGNAGAHVANCAAAFLNLPWGVSYHGTADFDYPTVSSLHWQIGRAAFVRCISYFILSQALRLAPPRGWDKLFVSYCGLPAPATLARRPPLPVSGRVKLVAVGRLSREKGQYVLLHAMRRLKDAGADFLLVIVGDGPDRRDLEALALESGIAEHCVFAGAVTETEVYRHMREADLLVCPSLMEGLPLVLMEAMAVGIPVVAPRIAGIPELVEDGVTGLLYTPADIEGFSAAILRLARDAALYDRIVAAGRARVIEGFAIESTLVPLAERLAAMRG